MNPSAYGAPPTNVCSPGAAGSFGPDRIYRYSYDHFDQVLTEDGVTIVHDDLGPRDGVPVVLCHGLAAAGAQLSADAEYFAGRGYRVLVPDLRGHGRSGKPAAMRVEDFSIARMAADMVAMLDQAGVGPVHWVGNSLGGWVAFELERRGRARTLTGIAPAGGWSRFTPAKFEIVFKFVAGLPVYLGAKVLGPRALRLPFVRQLAYVPVTEEGLLDLAALGVLAAWAVRVLVF